VDAVAPSFGSYIDDRVADAGGFGIEDFVFLADSQGKDIDQRIA